MKSKISAIAVLFVVVLLAGSAFADPVTYSTAGVFSCNGGANCSLIAGGVKITTNSTHFVTLTFAGLSNSSVVSSPAGTNASLGAFTVNATPNNSTGKGTIPTLHPILFTLNVTQTVPTAGSGSFTGKITGTIAYNSSTGKLTWSIANPSVVIGAETYMIDGSKVSFVPETTNGGSTSVQATVVGPDVPEPASLMLLGTGLLGAGRFARRRFIQ